MEMSFICDLLSKVGLYGFCNVQIGARQKGCIHSGMTGKNLTQSNKELYSITLLFSAPILCPFSTSQMS